MSESHITIPIPTGEEIGILDRVDVSVWVDTHTALISYAERIEDYGYEVRWAQNESERYPILRCERKYEGERTIRLTVFGPNYPWVDDDATAEAEKPDVRKMVATASAEEIAREREKEEATTMRSL